ncbi:MAG: hypothetical protein IIA34_09185 [Proteobacteria bacterium]|nr:hypothetical protein [Pseudomonadota bacterium]
MKGAVVARAFQSVTTLTSAGFPAAEVGGRARKNSRPGGTVIRSRSYGLARGLERPPGWWASAWQDQIGRAVGARHDPRLGSTSMAGMVVLYKQPFRQLAHPKF